MQDLVNNPSFADMLQEAEQPTKVVKEPTPPPLEQVVDVSPVKAEDTSKGYDKKYIDAGIDITLGFIDNAQNGIFKYIAFRRRKTACNEITDSTKGLLELRHTLNKLRANADKLNEPDFFTKTEKELLVYNEAVESFIEGLPLTDKEVENITPALRYMIEKNGGLIPPELALILGLATSIGARVGELNSI